MSGKTKHLDVELAALAALPDEAIDTSDVAEAVDWRNAERGRFFRPVKNPITIRLDADVLAWFKAHSSKYQTAINKALREYISSQ